MNIIETASVQPQLGGIDWPSGNGEVKQLQFSQEVDAVLGTPPASVPRSHNWTRSTLNSHNETVNPGKNIPGDRAVPDILQRDGNYTTITALDLAGTDSRPGTRDGYFYSRTDGVNDSYESSDYNAPKPVSLGDTNLSPAGTEAVMAPFHYISSLPSKGVRDMLIAALNLWVGAAPEALANVKSAVGDVHNISLMLDDVQDNSPMRRAKPATHCVFGMPQTVNSATYHIVDVISRARHQYGTESLDIVIDEMKNLLVGQSYDLLWTHLLSVPSVESYLQMVDGKTGGLFRMVSRLMIAQSTSPDKPESLDRLMTLFGRYFQIRDDYANLVSGQYVKTKGFAEDLDEGKYSFILIHALENADERTRTVLENLLMRRRVAGSADDCQKDLTLALLREIGSLAFTAQALRNLRDDIEVETSRLEAVTGKQNPAWRKILGALNIEMV